MYTPIPKIGRMEGEEEEEEEDKDEDEEEAEEEEEARAPTTVQETAVMMTNALLHEKDIMAFFVITLTREQVAPSESQYRDQGFTQGTVDSRSSKYIPLRITEKVLSK